MRDRVCSECGHTYFYVEDYDLSIHCQKCGTKWGSIDSFDAEDI